MPKKQRVVRVGVGSPDEPFAPAWRFWTHGDSAYFSHRVMGGLFKGSFHPASDRHASAIWTAGFTSESKVVIDHARGRRSHTWDQPPEFTPGWYRGPSISIPRLTDRPYDLPASGPHVGAGDSDVQCVDAQLPGSQSF
jgi:hypothetical protein